MISNKISTFFYYHNWRYRFFVDGKADKRQFFQVYDNSPHPPIYLNRCIVILSGKAHLWAFDTHGGFADRLKGIISIYKSCKDLKKEFKIFHTYPYKLESFLIPNQIDWTINSNEVVYNVNAVKPFYFRHSPYLKDEIEYSKWRLNKILKREKQCIHLYSNICSVTDDDFSLLFNELFKPSQALQREIDNHIIALDNSYISLSFRFTHLLGDPIDEYMEVLPDSEKKELMIKAFKSIEHFHYLYPNNKLLINSDSNSFLSYVKERAKDYVYIVPGIPVHIDQTDKASDSSYLKTFIDFFLIGKAQKVYLIKEKRMRNSGFPKCAAIVWNKPFEVYHI